METKLTRTEIVHRLIDRDGILCQLPGCNGPVDLTDLGHNQSPDAATVDHWFPQSWCRSQGWTDGQIWDLSNLKLMHKKCNASKGDRIPNADGSLPSKSLSRFRYRRQKRSQRPEICTACMSGRSLLIGEQCQVCGSGPQPIRYPAAYNRRTTECSHSGYESCWACTLAIVERQPAIITVLDGEFLDE